MYAKLTKLPLLQGMNAKEIGMVENMSQILETHGGHTLSLYEQGQTCTHLSLLVAGSLMRTYKSPNGDYEFQETLQAPWVVEPESLYGLRCNYTSTYKMMEDGILFTISKRDMAYLFESNEIFRMNYMNLLAASLQHHRSHQLDGYTTKLADRMLSFITQHAITQTGPKTLRIKMSDFAHYLNDTRLNISHVMNKWNDIRLAELQRMELHIPRLENLISYVKST